MQLYLMLREESMPQRTSSLESYYVGNLTISHSIFTRKLKETEKNISLLKPMANLES